VMRTLDDRHPCYGFADHKGYPVRAHYAALSRFGACAAHRRSFEPVRKALGLPPLPSERVVADLSTDALSRAARDRLGCHFRGRSLSRTTSCAFLSDRRPR
jgi:hypothetical protein